MPRSSKTPRSSIKDIIKRISSTLSTRSSRKSMPNTPRQNIQAHQDEVLMSHFGNESARSLVPKSLRRNSEMNRGEQDDERPLRSSQAAISLHDNEAEVCYSTGRKSILNLQDERAESLSGQIRRMSVAALPSVRDMNEEDEEDTLDYTASSAAEYRTSVISNRNSILEAAPSSEKMLSRRNSSIISNRDSRLSSYRDSITQVTSALSRRSSMQASNIELVNQRNDNPEMRKRPSSAGVEEKEDYSLIKKLLKEEEEAKALSDGEVDTMAIECKYDMIAI